MIDDPRIVQGMRRQSALRAERLHAGAKLIGWKVGFGAPAAQAKMKLSGPLIGIGSLLGGGLRTVFVACAVVALVSLGLFRIAAHRLRAAPSAVPHDAARTDDLRNRRRGR